MNASSYVENALIEEKLRLRGFVQDLGFEDGPICRWQKQGLLLDMMPKDPTVLGFGKSRWFSAGYESAQSFKLPDGH